MSVPAWLRRAALAVLGLALLAGAWTLLVAPIPGLRLLKPARPRNLLIVSLDTVRADRLGSYHYKLAQTPRLDALAASGLRFEQASTVVPLTLPAHSSLMTGTFPAWHGVRDNGGFYLDDDQLTLAEILRDRGLPHRRLRRRVRARSPLGDLAGIRPLLRRFRSRQVTPTRRRWT